MNAPAFDALEYLENVHGTELGDGTRAYVWEH